MSERIVYSTEQSGVELRQLTTSDASPFYAAVDSNREHLRRFAAFTSMRFPDLASVLASIESPEEFEENTLRMGIWNQQTFLGAMNLKRVHDTHYEITYWLDEKHTGNGYATIALRALARRAPRYTELFTAINPDDTAGSMVALRAGFAYDSNDGDMAYFTYRKPAAKTQQEPVLYASLLSQDEHSSKALVGLRGQNTAVVNHGSTTTYKVLIGNGSMNIDGFEHWLHEGMQVSVPAGVAYQDKGDLLMEAISEPPFDPSTVEPFGFDLF